MYKIGIKSYADFQKMLNQWETSKIKFKILKVEFINEQVHFLVYKEN
jgi:hypothetical protein